MSFLRALTRAAPRRRYSTYPPRTADPAGKPYQHGLAESDELMGQWALDEYSGDKVAVLKQLAGMFVGLATVYQVAGFFGAPARKPTAERPFVSTPEVLKAAE